MDRRLGPVARHASWLIPSAVCLAVFWPGILAWFQRDDFAWLGLRRHVFQTSDLWNALFAPKAQGTIRPWSERGFFMLYSWLFGLEALPYRLTVFVTQALAIFLLSRVAWRLSAGNARVALLAPLLWVVNPALATPLSWTSAYNQVMCSAFLLGAFLLWLGWVETGERWRYRAQLAVFVAGFGALEINIVYPGIVLAWCVLARAWRRIVWAMPMAAISAAYYAYHRSVAPRAESGPYAMHVDPASLWMTFRSYWVDAFGGRVLASFDVPAWFIELGHASAWILTAALAVFVAVAVRRRAWLALFGFAWFLAALAPVIPLRDHISDYYLCIPSIGLALTGAQAIVWAWNWRGWAGAAALAVAAVVYAAPAIYVARGSAQYNRVRSQEAEVLVFGAARVRELHPKEAILLAGVSSDLFWAAVRDKPFRLLGLEHIYLAPGSEDSIQAHPELGNVNEFVFPAGQVRELLDSGGAVVYSAAEGGRLRNVTSMYRSIAQARWKPALPNRVEAGNPLFARYFVEGWYPIEEGNRWMGRRAVVELGMPAGPGPRRLILQGYLARAMLAKGPMRLTVSVDGKAVGAAMALGEPDAEFIRMRPLPAAITANGGGKVRVVLELDHGVVPPGEDRELGLLFGSIGIE